MVHRNCIKSVAVYDEIVAFYILVYVLVADGELTKAQGEEACEDVVVIAAQVDHFGVVLL